jgi:hypothetical protein
MADITDPQAIYWVNHVVRRHAEVMRALKYRIDADMVTWYAEISALVPNDSSVVMGDLPGDGASRLTGVDVNLFVAQMAAFKAALEQSGVPQVISKPCWRTLQDSLTTT